jgi:hypothetical protein
MKTLLGLATAAAAMTVTFAGPAQAASLPCGLGSNGNTASATCWSGSSYTWRLVVDCLDTSNIKWPKTVNTLYGAYIKGDGTETLSCAGNLKASARLEAK